MSKRVARLVAAMRSLTESIASPQRSCPVWVLEQGRTRDYSEGGRCEGGGTKRGEENRTRDTPPKKRGWDPPFVCGTFPPLWVSLLCFSCTKSPKLSRPEEESRSVSGECVLWYVFLPYPIRFGSPPPPYDGPNYTLIFFFYVAFGSQSQGELTRKKTRLIQPPTEPHCSLRAVLSATISAKTQRGRREGDGKKNVTTICGKRHDNLRHFTTTCDIL